MSKEFIGDACAHCKIGEAKASYPRIGAAFRDGDRISIKIDTIPIPGQGWTGWINIFPREKVETRARPAALSDDSPF